MDDEPPPAYSPQSQNPASEDVNEGDESGAEDDEPVPPPAPDIYSSAAMKSDAFAPAPPMGECGNCGRRFAVDRLGRHETTCKKSDALAKKRKTFDVRAQRVQGTDAEAYVKSAAKKGILDQQPDPNALASARELKRRKWKAASEQVGPGTRRARGGWGVDSWRGQGWRHGRGAWCHGRHEQTARATGSPVAGTCTCTCTCTCALTAVVCTTHGSCAASLAWGSRATTVREARRWLPSSTTAFHARTVAAASVPPPPSGTSQSVTTSVRSRSRLRAPPVGQRAGQASHRTPRPQTPDPRPRPQTGEGPPRARPPLRIGRRRRAPRRLPWAGAVVAAGPTQCRPCKRLRRAKAATPRLRLSRRVAVVLYAPRRCRRPCRRSTLPSCRVVHHRRE